MHNSRGLWLLFFLASSCQTWTCHSAWYKIRQVYNIVTYQINKQLHQCVIITAKSTSKILIKIFPVNNLVSHMALVGYCGVHMRTFHYDDVTMGTMAAQITSLAIVYSTFYSGADQSKHQSSASMAFVWGIHRDRWIPRTNGQLRGKCFHSMTSSC